jgi:NADH-quinone oxidoreductase subunit N
MAAGVKAAGFAAILRIVTVELAPAASIWTVVLWWLAVLTMVVPNLIALAQDNVKRMLAYSSIAHAGYLLVGVVAGSAAGRSAALLYLAVYAVMTLGAFALVGAMASAEGSRGGLADFRGLGWRRPLLGALLVLFLLSLAGFPPTGGFIGKLYLLLAAVEAGHATLAVILVLTSFVSYYYYLRVIWKMYFEEAPAGEDLSPRRIAPLSQPAAPVGVTETSTD